MKTTSVLNKTKQKKMIYHAYQRMYSCCYSKRSCSHLYDDAEKLYREISQYVNYIASDSVAHQRIINIQEYEARKMRYIRNLEQVKESIAKKFRNKKEAYRLPLLMNAHSRFFRYLKDNNIRYNLPENGVNLMMLIIAMY